MHSSTQLQPAILAMSCSAHGSYLLLTGSLVCKCFQCQAHKTRVFSTALCMWVHVIAKPNLAKAAHLEHRDVDSGIWGHSFLGSTIYHFGYWCQTWGAELFINVNKPPCCLHPVLRHYSLDIQLGLSVSITRESMSREYKLTRTLKFWTFVGMWSCQVYEKFLVVWTQH